MLTGRVLLTGSGFLVRGILRRAHKENWPAELVVYSRSAASQALCKRKYPDAQYVLGDIRDIDRLQLAMLSCDTVIHTAALKFIPEAETNVTECVSVNVEGTLNVLRAAENSVEKCLLISTDKAVLPTNVYGMTKALTERLMIEMASFSQRKYTAVRYGNVIGSSGSVVPVLMEQAAREGFVTVTNPQMTRFWISINEAIDLILFALSNKINDGSILIPDPQSMILESLVNAILPDTKIKLIGLRPGEKMHEELITEAESIWTKDHNIGYELLAPLNRSQANEPFSLSSEDAERISEEAFLEAVQDAKNV